jgi:ferredoxin--NADP+ reductase
MDAPPLGSADSPLRVAVIGAGPAGFYVADALSKRETPRVSVDLLERLPTPYGLVRYGVAPDHQKIKSVIKAYEKTAVHPRVRLLCNVRVCAGDLAVDDLLRHYDQVVFTVGCATDRRLGIPGEDLAGSHPATSFVAWYNGHPNFREHPVSLDTERAVVIGVGDVAMDLARMLVKDHDELATTDIADEALAVFRENRVKEVVIVARRGPGEAAFASKELEDIVALPNIDVIIDATDIQAARATEGTLDGLAKRKLMYLTTLSEKTPTGAPKVVRLRFLLSPVRILENDGKVAGIELERNILSVDGDGRVSARGTGARETIEAGLVFRSVGYRGVPLDGVPFDDRSGVIPNRGGRVVRDGETWPRVYCAGWIKRGPSGVIGTNKSDATDTVVKMMEDAAALEPEDRASRSPEAVDALLERRGVRVVSFSDWKHLDELEIVAGKETGRVRRKFTRVEEMLSRLRR